MKMTTKGQVTIPLQVRTNAGLVPGCEIEFVEEKGRIYLRKAADSGRGAAIVKAMTGRGSVNMSTDQILALTRGKR